LKRTLAPGWIAVYGIPIVMAGALVAAPTAFAAAPGVTITESAAFPNQAAGPCEIHFTDGGIGWVEEIVANKIGRCDPMTGAITETSVAIPLSVPGGEAIGADGGVWFTEIGNNAIGRIDLSTHAITSYVIPTPLAGPIIIHRGPDNTMISPEATANKVGQIDITTHGFTEYPGWASSHCLDVRGVRPQPAASVAQRRSRTHDGTRRADPGCLPTGPAQS